MLKNKGVLILKTVCIVCGGVSSEHEISLISATSILSNIDREKYNVITLIIDREGRFFCTDDFGTLADEGWKKLKNLCRAIIPQGSYGGIFKVQGDRLQHLPVDVFFPVLHGENGEDGIVQGVFKMSGIPYVGGSVLASACCMDKELTHIRLDSAGIKTAPYIAVRQNCFDIQEVNSKIKESFGYPVFVKPANAGSSVGVSKAGDINALETALQEAFKVDKKVLVEKNIVGAEVECAVIGNECPEAAKCLGQIAQSAEFYDFDAKYKDSSTKLYIPANISTNVAEKIRETAVLAYKTMELSGLSRVDFFVLENGEFILNEINNLPGFTKTSMYPKLFEASGISYTELIDKLIETAQLK